MRTTSKQINGAMIRQQLEVTQQELAAARRRIAELEPLGQELAAAKRRIAELEGWHAPGCPAAGVAEQISTTRTITCAECGDVLHEETIEGDWPDGDGVPSPADMGSSPEAMADLQRLHDSTLGVLGNANLDPQQRITAVVAAHWVERFRDVTPPGGLVRLDVDEIAELAGTSPQIVQENLDALDGYGLLTVERRWVGDEG